MPTTVCRATGRGWAAFTRRSRAAGIECFAGGVNVALRGSGSTRCWLASRFLLPESLTRARSLWPASGNLREEPSAGKPLARICGGESRMAELPDHHPLCADPDEIDREEVHRRVSVDALKFFNRTLQR